MSSAPDVSAMNEALAKRKASALGKQLPFQDWSSRCRRLSLMKSPVPCVTDNPYILGFK